MDAPKVIKELKRNYPGKDIIKNRPKAPSEIICEITTYEDNAAEGLAVAVIDKSVPHYHKDVVETYKILRGFLLLHMEGKTYQLREGNSFVIKPGEIHWAEGKETWVEVVSRPAWRPESHIVVNEK